jgi:hypothetical protein
MKRSGNLSKGMNEHKNYFGYESSPSTQNRGSGDFPAAANKTVRLMLIEKTSGEVEIFKPI